MSSWLECLCGNRSSGLSIGGHRYSIVKLLGDGGYAFVYLVRREDTGGLYALKKIRCLFGGESVANAMREIDACNKLKHTGLVVPCVDSAVVQEDDGSKIVYIVMPYYKNGTLADRIAEKTATQSSLGEPTVLRYALGICDALEAMHSLHTLPNQSSEDAITNDAGVDADGAGERDRLLDLHEMGERVPYAHRDLKPANVMFDDNNRVVLIDLGSCSPAKVDVSSRQHAVQLQDMAAEHCTLPYRAPELFDVRTGARINEKVDVWGFGCTLYCMMYGVNPFEREEQNGGNINICIARGKFSFPQEPPYSDELKDVVKQCLTPDPAKRPPISDVAERLRNLLSQES